MQIKSFNFFLVFLVLNIQMHVKKKAKTIFFFLLNNTHIYKYIIINTKVIQNLDNKLIGQGLELLDTLDIQEYCQSSYAA
jgi:hypothetical protein